MSEVILFTAHAGKYSAGILITLTTPFGPVYWIVEGVTEVYVASDKTVGTERAQSAGQRAAREGIYQAAGEAVGPYVGAVIGPKSGFVAKVITKLGGKWGVEGRVKEAFREGGRIEVRTGRDASPGAR